MSPKITICNRQKDLPIRAGLIRRVVAYLLNEFKVSTHEVTFHFVTESAISDIHKKFFNDPTPTDCITFPLDPPFTDGNDYHVLGEVFLCPKIAIQTAPFYHVCAQEELLRYLIHGLLHLIGYEDQDPLSRAKMKRKENACLKKIHLLEFLKCVH